MSKKSLSQKDFSSEALVGRWTYIKCHAIEWWSHCVAQNKPYITASISGRRVTVIVRLITSRQYFEDKSIPWVRASFKSPLDGGTLTSDRFADVRKIIKSVSILRDEMEIIGASEYADLIVKLVLGVIETYAKKKNTEVIMGTNGAKAVVELYYNGKSTGVITNASGEGQFIEAFAEAIETFLANREKSPELHTPVCSWIGQAVDICARLRGYKSPVAEERRLICGSFHDLSDLPIICVDSHGVVEVGPPVTDVQEGIH